MKSTVKTKTGHRVKSLKELSRDSNKRNRAQAKALVKKVRAAKKY